MKKTLPIQLYNLTFKQKKLIAHAFFLSIMVVMPIVFLSYKFAPFQQKAFVFFILSVFTAYVFNCLVLIPRLLDKKKITSFLISMILFLVLIFFLRVLLSDIIFDTSFHLLKPKPPFFETKGKVFGFAIQLANGDVVPFLPVIVPVIFAFAVSTSIEITARWYQQSQLEKDIENERLNSELLFLKSQINPHFLFNTLNNIYSLAVDKSDHTETSILMLSQMMRYMLYDTNAKKVELTKEIEYIENYLELQKLRLSQSKNIKIESRVVGNIDQHSIAPLLLIPLVENAFKHGVSYQQSSKIAVSFECNNDQLYFKVQNTKPVDHLDKNLYHPSGIGLKNIKRRLDLLYPGRYQFFIEDTANQYIVELSLILNDNKLHSY